MKSISRVSMHIFVPIVYMCIGVLAINLILVPFSPIITSVKSLLFSDVISNNNELDSEVFVPLILDDNDIQSDIIYYEDISWPEYGEEYGRLNCDRIGLNASVVWGDDYELLRKSAGTYTGSGIPGAGRTMIIAGHNTMEFNCLKNIQSGDIIVFTTAYGIYEYQVKDSVILQYNDPTAFDLAKDEEELVLYTCYPFTELGSTSTRCFVHATKIFGPNLVNREAANE